MDRTAGKGGKASKVLGPSQMNNKKVLRLLMRN
jgi:hypothetical protein